MTIDDNEPVETPEGEEQPTETTETGENGTGEEVLELTEEAEAEPEKPKGKSVQERIDELTAARREAEREAEFWRSKATEKQPEPEPEGDGRPDPGSYEFGEADPAYWEALTEWKAEQKIEAKLAEHQQRQKVELAVQKVEAAYSERLQAAREELPDYDDKVTKSAARGEWPCPPLVAIAIKESEVGPKVAYHLATNRGEAIQLANMSPIEQAVQFGRLEERFRSQPKTTAKIATDAPEPAQARTKGGQFAPSGVLADNISADDWMKRRNAQIGS